MTNRFLKLCTLGLIAFHISFNLCAQTSEEKIPLTQEQILGNLPKGILKDRASIAGWQDSENILIRQNTPSGRQEMLYNVKKGTFQKVQLEQKKGAPSLKTDNSLMEQFISAVGKDTYKKTILHTFSPDSSMLAYLRANNLYIFSFADNKETALTTDGTNVLMNGYASWVYYEEILGRSSLYQAFWWSPDSKKIAYYKFDDSNIPMFPIYNSQGKYGFITETRYPKAGDENPKVDIFVAYVDDASKMAQSEHIKVDFNREDDQYFGIPFWNADGSRFIIPWMPREQNHLLLYSVNPEDGTKSQVYEEKQDTWIDWMEDMQFTSEGFYVIRDFEMWEQIYFQSFDGKVLKRITDGKNWGIRFIEVDEQGGYIYYMARKESSVRYDFYKVSLKDGEITRLTEGEYNYGGIKLSPDKKHFAAMRSNSSTPSQLVVASTGKKRNMQVIYDTKGEKFDQYKLAIPEMLYINVDGYTLPAQVIWPIDLDSTKKYPVIVSMYGGPNSGHVMDKWIGINANTQWWANEGVIFIEIDHRGSGHCGKEGLNFMHRNLLTVELHDYIEWVKELYKRPFVNRDKVGITGFSYGGSMTMLACTVGSDYFKYGIAGGGVYDYSLYDTHYTERYMDRPQDNPDGYANTRIMDKVKHYKGDKTNYVKITHGTSDDNVHMQNTMQLVDALQKAGKQFDLMLYPGGYHGYRGKQALHSDISDYIFWYRHLLEKEAPEILIK